MRYFVSNVSGDEASFTQEEDAIAFAKRKARESSAFTWFVDYRETVRQHIGQIRGRTEFKLER